MLRRCSSTFCRCVEFQMLITKPCACAASIVMAQTQKLASNMSLIIDLPCGSSHNSYNSQTTGIRCAGHGKQELLALCWRSAWPKCVQ